MTKVVRAVPPVAPAVVLLAAEKVWLSSVITSFNLLSFHSVRTVQ